MIYLGFDIGGTKSAVLFGSSNGKILWRRQIKTGTPEQTLGTLFALAGDSGYRADCAGVSCGGPLDERQGIILSPPNLPGWEGIQITDMISRRFGIHAYLCNDANASALAEWRFGAGRGTQNMIFCTFGTGMGAGLILDGRLYSGTNGNAGEIGHIRMEKSGPTGYGKAGSFEGFVSGGGIAQLGRAAAQKRLESGLCCAYCRTQQELDTITAETVAAAAVAGDKTAKSVYSLCGRYLGRGLALLVDLLNPERIVLGSIFARSGGLLIPAMEEELERECLPDSYAAVEIVAAELGEKTGDYAAVVTAMRGEKQNV